MAASGQTVSFKVLSYNGLQNVLPFFYEGARCTQMYNWCFVRRLTDQGCLVDMGAARTQWMEALGPSSWKKYVISIRAKQFWTANCKVVNSQSIVPLFIRIRYLPIHPSFGNVQHLTADIVLGTLLIDKCILRMFPTERRIVPWYFRPVPIVIVETATNFINADPTDFYAKYRPQQWHYSLWK